MDDTLKTEWSGIADEWIRRLNTQGDTYREGVLDSCMLEAIGDVSGLQVVDLGCGEGRFSRMLTERGAHVTGVDLCPRFVEYAEAHKAGDETYVVGDMERLGGSGDESFDLAVSYLSLVDVVNLGSAVREAHRVLRPGGRFVVCNLHPMSTAGNCWVKDENGNKLHFRLDNYFDESGRDMKMCGGMVTNFHRTLGTYLNTFLDVGFRLDGIREPRPSPEQVAQYPDTDDLLRVPHFIIYLLRKEP
ncbi:MAG: class I SAM-dependent methyltransferase [Armatimonadetes bacterium]|nr:class I SAM-dependent methyltransferase [Armatimonadota bacterium]